MDEAEYRRQLDELEEQLSDLYRRRRQLTAAYADDHPAVLPARVRDRSEVQQRVARCPRCGGRLSEPGGMEKT